MKKIFSLITIFFLTFSVQSVAQETMKITQCHPSIIFKLISCKAAGDICVIEFSISYEADHEGNCGFNYHWAEPILKAVDDEGNVYKGAKFDRDAFGMFHFNGDGANMTCTINGYGEVYPGKLESTMPRFTTVGCLAFESGEKKKGTITITGVPQEASYFKYLHFYLRNQYYKTENRPIKIEYLPINHLEDE